MGDVEEQPIAQRVLDYFSRPRETDEARRQLVPGANREFPSFEYEAHPCSPHSPGLVGMEERLARFIYSPHHWDAEFSRANPNAFDDILHRGCSVERVNGRSEGDMHASARLRIVKAGVKYEGYQDAVCSDIRSLIHDDDTRVAGVADTARSSNQFHGDILAKLGQKERNARSKFEVWKLFVRSAFIVAST